MGEEKSIIGGDVAAAVNIMMDGAINSHKGRFTYHGSRRGWGWDQGWSWVWGVGGLGVGVWVRVGGESAYTDNC